MIKPRLTALAAMIAISANGYADTSSDSYLDSSRFAVSGGIGTLGIGANVYYKINDYFQVKGLISNLSISHEIEQDDLSLEASIEGTNLGVVLDTYPFKGSFRLFAGYLNYGNQFNLSAVPTDGTITINDEEYDTSTDVQSIEGKITTDSAAGLFGMGWGNPMLYDNLGVVFDMGVVMLNGSTVDLEAVCYENSLVCHSAQTSVDEEKASLQNDINDTYKFWPYINLAMSYHF